MDFWTHTGHIQDGRIHNRLYHAIKPRHYQQATTATTSLSTSIHTQSIYSYYLLSYILYQSTFLHPLLLHLSIYYLLPSISLLSILLYPSISYLFISPSIACYMLPKYVYIHLYTTLYSYIYTSIYQSYIYDMLYPMSSLYAILPAA